MKIKTLKFELWLSILAIIIALVGGVPGIINVLDYFQRSGILISYNSNQSMSSIIRSSNTSLNGKPTVLLYQLTIAGRGSEPSFIKDISLEFNIKDKVLKGKQFHPKQSYTKKGGNNKLVHVIFEKSKQITNVYILNWIDFKPGEKSIGYGEPVIFSYAAYFDVNPNEFAKCKNLKIIVKDYLGNVYSEIVDFSEQKKQFQNYFLIQD